MSPAVNHTKPQGSTPSFAVIGREPIRPAALLLAVLAAAAGLWLIGFGLSHSRARHFVESRVNPARSKGGSTALPDEDDDKDDDPKQVDTIYLGDAADAPVPETRAGRASRVHATILIKLPRYGPQAGLIPDSPVGHLMYQWLAAFNQASLPAMQHVLPNSATGISAAAQMQLRQATGGFNLLSAKEVQPGLLVFRLRDQTTGTEALGTLQMREGSSPPTIASFSIRDVP